MPFISGDVFWLDTFAIRQWDDPSYAGTRISHDKEDFVDRMHHAFHAEGRQLVDGYAPFCKHLFVPNFVRATVGALAITDANRHLLRSGYTRRRPEELAVLTRWFPADQVQPPPAKFLDIILYSREQLLKEYEALPYAEGNAELPGVPWGIISIKAQDEDYETPMQPITMLRNALGREEGGSGVPLERDKYEAAVAYWDTHATIQ
ncbi:hypothetical protein N2152v2_004973 [Parachlorella kessleri]